jgi:hypothetical protein
MMDRLTSYYLLTELRHAFSQVDRKKRTSSLSSRP